MTSIQPLPRSGRTRGLAVALGSLAVLFLTACPGATDVVAGEIVTTGTWTDAWPVRPGETWTARFDSALPALEVAFA